VHEHRPAFRREGRRQPLKHFRNRRELNWCSHDECCTGVIARVSRPVAPERRRKTIPPAKDNLSRAELQYENAATAGGDKPAKTPLAVLRNSAADSGVILPTLSRGKFTFINCYRRQLIFNNFLLDFLYPTVYISSQCHRFTCL
jgi:hypothetical protein